MEVSQEERITSKKFEQMVHKLDLITFHIYRKIKPEYGEMYVIEWGIYDKRVPWNIFWSDDYKPLISSKTHTIKDLKRFVKENAMPQIIHNWEELGKVPPTDKFKIIIDEKFGASGWVVPIKETQETQGPKYFDYHLYLSTHTFYGSQYKYYTRKLQEMGFNIQLDSWDKPKDKRN